MSNSLTKKEKDILRLIHSNCHIGSRNYNQQMRRFIYSISKQGVPIFNVSETYERIRLAALIIAGIQDQSEVYAISSRESGQRAVVKFAVYTGCSVSSSQKWTPGALTNYETKQFKEPKLLIVVDPYADFKPIKEGSYTNIPVIALCDTHNNLKFVDIVIPCNNNHTESISMIFWMLAREVLILRGGLQSGESDWNQVQVELFYQKRLEDLKEEEKSENREDEEEEEEESEQEAEESEEEKQQGQPAQDDWSEENQFLG